MILRPKDVVDQLAPHYGAAVAAIVAAATAAQQAAQQAAQRRSQQNAAQAAKQGMSSPGGAPPSVAGGMLGGAAGGLQNKDIQSQLQSLLKNNNQNTVAPASGNTLGSVPQGQTNPPQIPFGAGSLSGQQSMQQAIKPEDLASLFSQGGGYSF